MMIMGMGMRKARVASRKNAAKAAGHILDELSSFIEKILSSKILKSQISNK